jgi:hypothetical protein
MSEVEDNFLDAFGDALSVDGTVHNLVFSNGVNTPIDCLWVKDASAYFHTHSQTWGPVLSQNQKMLLFREKDVPARAYLRSNEYLVVDGTKYKIVTARLRDYIWTLTLMILTV